MDLLLTLILGKPISILMLISFVVGIIYLLLVIPYKIATDKNPIFNKRVVNIILGALSIFIPFIHLFFLLKSPKILSTAFFSYTLLILSVIIWILRYFSANFII